MSTLAELGRIAKAQSSDNDGRNLAMAVGGTGLATAGFSNRIPDAVEAGRHRIAVGRLQRHRQGHRAMDERGGRVDPSTLSRESTRTRHVWTDPATGRERVNTSRGKSEYEAARGRWTKKHHDLRRAAKPRSPGFGSRVAGITIPAAVGIPMAVRGARGLFEPKDGVAKALDRDDVDRFAAGGLAAGAAYHVPSYGWEHNVARPKWKRQTEDDPRLKARYEAHKAKHDLGPRGGKEWKDFFRTYPRDLPGGAVRRTMAHTHAGKTGMALTAGFGAAGGIGTAAVGRRNDRKKGLR